MSIEVGYAVEVHQCDCDRPAGDERKKIFEFIKPNGEITYKCGIGFNDCPRIDEMRRNTDSVLGKPKK